MQELPAKWGIGLIDPGPEVCWQARTIEFLPARALSAALLISLLEQPG
jgi:hypothetical protein